MNNDPEDDDLYEYDDEFDAADGYDEDLDQPRPLWTRNRLLLTIVVLIIVITFLVYTLQGLFLPIPSPPPPTFAPGSLI